MKIEKLEAALDRYGGDLARWPATLRADAEAFAASDVRAARLVAEARRLDAALASAVSPMTVDAALVGRIVSSLGAGAHHDVTVKPTPRLYAWASAAVVAFLVTGYAVGLAVPASQGEDAFAGLMFGNSSTSDTAATDESGSVL